MLTEKPVELQISWTVLTGGALRRDLMTCEVLDPCVPHVTVL
jgi:hypothetical protein